MDFGTEIKRLNQNWNVVRKRLIGLKLPEERDDSFVCPLCLGCFYSEQWSDSYLSIEHIPPHSLGGKPRTITCKKCNNTHGATLDSWLFEEQRFIELGSLTPDAAVPKGKYQIDGMDDPLPARFSVTDTGSIQVLGVPKATNPAEIEKILNILPSTKPTNFSMKLIFSVPNPHRTKIARLRIAYLYVFSLLGYYALFNNSFLTLREQIMKPTEKIIDHFLEGRTNDDSKDDIDHLADKSGVSVVYDKLGFQGLFVVFPLVAPAKSVAWYYVILPKPTNNGLEILHSIPSGQTMNFTEHQLSESTDFETNLLSATAFWEM